MKKDMSDIINEIIKYKLKYEDRKDLPIVSAIIKYNVFNLPYYNDFYSKSFISVENEDVKIEFLNTDLNLANNEKNFHFNHEFSELKELYVEECNVLYYQELLSSFILSSNITEYVSSLKNKSDSDIKFKSFFEDNFDYFNKTSFKVCIDIAEFKSLFSKENNSYLYKLAHNEILYNVKNKLFQERKEKSLEKVLSLKSNIKSLNILNSLFNNEIDECFTELKKDHNYLFEKPTLENISFEFFEIQESEDDKDYFVPENISIFKKNILGKHNIEKKKLNKDKKYYSLSSQLYLYISEQYNEINKNFNHDLYGIDFLERDIFDRKSGIAGFLIAKKNNEVVSVICFSSLNRYDSLYKSISTSVKHNHRGIGLSSLMYDKLANIFNDLDLTFVNSHYSEEGANKLKENKNKLNHKYKNAFFFDTCINSFSNEKYKEELYIFSKKFLENIKKIQIVEDVEIKASIIKKNYLKYKQKIITELENKKDIDYDEIFENFKNNIIEYKKDEKKYKLN